LISELAHGEDTRHSAPVEFLGNLVLLIGGGNETTRNSMSGGVLALNLLPGEYDKLRANPAPQLIRNMVSEIIRWQTPLAYMLRTAVETPTYAASASAPGTGCACGTSPATGTMK